MEMEMDSHNVARNDSFVERARGDKNGSLYNFRVESPVSESCSTFGWAACRACFAGMRSVKECLAVLFCLGPDESSEVCFYKSPTSTERLRQLTIPLLSEPKRCSEKPEPVKGSPIEDSGDSKQPEFRIFWNDISLKFETLPPLPVVPPVRPQKKEEHKPSMTYESLPGYNSDLSSSDSEGPL